MGIALRISNADFTVTPGRRTDADADTNTDADSDSDSDSDADTNPTRHLTDADGRPNADTYPTALLRRSGSGICTRR